MVSKEETTRVAKLAKISLTDAETNKLSETLNTVVDYVKVLDELDVNSVRPTFQVTGKTNSVSQDIIKPSLTQEEVISNAKEKKNSFIVTNIVVNKNSH